MKHLKMTLLGLFSIILMAFIVLIPMRVDAATIENGQNIKLLRQGKAFYKFTLSDDSLVQISWSKNDKNNAKVTIYTDKNKQDQLYGINYMGKSGKDYLALGKGTYYVDMYDGNSSVAPKTIVKFNWTSASKYDKGNYSIATAQTLKSNTIVRIPQVHKYNYNRWYKLTLSKAQLFKMTMIYGEDIGICIYDSKIQYITGTWSFKDEGGNSYSYTYDELLPKGTYYIEIMMTEPNCRIGKALAFKWE